MRIKVLTKELSFAILTTFCILAVWFFPSVVLSNILISEVMYDLPGGDTDKEWVEIKNDGTESYNLSELRFFDRNGGHLLKDISDRSDLPIGACAVIVNNGTFFKSDNPGYVGTVIDSSFSLSNEGDAISIRSDSGFVFDSINYSKIDGASGDGNSLKREGDKFLPGVPTLGDCGSYSKSDLTEFVPVESSSQEQESPILLEDQTVQSISVSRIKIEPQIFASIEGKSNLVAGVEYFFRGETYGLQKEPIEQARQVWSFGDGVLGSGKTVSHTWRVPGDYVLVMESSSGEYNASARLKLSVAKAKISVVEIYPGEDGHISVKNSGRFETDLSGWILSAAGSNFILPPNTIILPGAILPFSNLVTGLRPAGETKLFFPNGIEAAVFNSPILSDASENFTEIPNEKMTHSTNPPKIEQEIKIGFDSSKEKNENKKSDSDYNQNRGSVASQNSALVYKSTSGSGDGIIDWILALIGLIGVGVLGMLFSKRSGAVLVDKDSTQGLVLSVSGPKAEDFEIFEDIEDGKK